MFSQGMRILSALLLFFALPASSVAAQLRVVTTTTDLRSLAEFVGGELITVSSIGTGREDVHLLAAKPSFMVQANRADLWIRIGLELEIGFEPLVLAGARNPNIHVGQRGHLDASHGVFLLDVPTTPVDRSLGDVHPMGNPHYHLDPYNGKVMARNIRDRLSDLDPPNRDAYNENYRAFCDRLNRAMFGDGLADAVTDATRLWAAHTAGEIDELIAAHGLEAEGWYGLLKPFRGARMVAYHRSWGYFARRFALEIIDELEPKPGIPPTSRHLAALATRMQALDVPVILMEPFYSRKAPDLLAARTNARVVEVGNMVDAEADAKDYITMIDAIVRRLATTLDATTRSRHENN